MKLHPLSVVFRALSRGVSVGVALFFVGTGTAAFELPFGVLAAPLLALVGIALGVGWELAYYRRFEYALTDDTLDIDSGVLSRRRREIPLRRVQNVDISQGIVQRALDLAVVNFETAGGGETEARLRYVSYGEAKRLQRDIQRRKRGEAETAGEQVENGELLFELTDKDLLLLGLVAPDLRALLPVLFFAVPAVGISIPDLLLESGAFAVGPRGVLLALVSWFGTGAVTAVRYYDFRLTRLDDELRYERGLLSRYDGSIPLDKIQQLDIRENALMRRFGYAALGVETAGYTPGEGPSGGSEAAIPLAERETLLALARSIEGFDFGTPIFERPPHRARRRYAVRYALVVVAVTGALFAANALLEFALLRFWYVLLAGLPFVLVAAHYKWLHRGYHVSLEHILTRNGFWRRSIAVVPAYRVQTVIQTATPFQRWRSLATVEIDTAGSLSVTKRGARAVDFDTSVATDLRETVRRRLHESLVAHRRPWTPGEQSDDVPSETDADNDSGYTGVGH